jgi:hypothetical protein
VDGFDLSGILSFDSALRRAVVEDGIHNDAKTVQVVLGSADADALHWGHGKRLFYAVDWAGLCVYPIGGPAGAPTPARCSVQDWGTVIDARTGAFIVSGTG